MRQDRHSPQQADHRCREVPRAAYAAVLTADDPQTGHRRNRFADDVLEATSKGSLSNRRDVTGHARGCRLKCMRMTSGSLRRRLR